MLGNNNEQVFWMDHLDQVAGFLGSGGVLAYPSESIWGLGCDAFHQKALEHILRLKDRDLGKGLIVLTDQAQRLLPLWSSLPADQIDGIISRITSVTNEQMLTQKQAVTWLVPVNKQALPALLTGGFDSLAVRITPHPTLSQLCQKLVSPTNPFGFLVSTSCNISGLAPAISLDEAMACFGPRVSYLSGDGLGFDKPSQIIDAASGQRFR